MNAIFITGTDTGVGKTLVSAIVVRALDAAYWKPVQSGDHDSTDTMRVKDLAGNDTRCYPESYVLSQPVSPHAAAAADGVTIQLAEMVLPFSPGFLVVEGAGGVLVPLNEEELFADWVALQGLPVILVSLNRLGSINHTLLSVESLLNRHLDILGIIFNGEPAEKSESFILNYTLLPCLGCIPWTASPDARFVQAQADLIRPALSAAMADRQ